MRNSICKVVLLVSAGVLVATSAWGQQSTSPTKQNPVAFDLSVTYAAERARVVDNQCCFWMQGASFDAAVTLWKRLGIAASLTGDHAAGISSGVDVNKISYLAGPRYTYTAWASHAGVARAPRYQLFTQALFGGVHGFDGLYPSGASATSSANAFALGAGGGFNYYLTPHWGLRVLEAGYLRTTLPNGAANVQDDLRLAFGVTYHVGSVAAPPLTLACTADPVAVFPGDPVSLTATAGGLDPKLNAIYSWVGNGATGNGVAVTVATDALAAGSHAVTCRVKEGKPGKEGLKPGQSAQSSASFMVKSFEPPTLSCSANPETIKPGASATIMATGISPQNRPLTYSYSAAAGTISGSGSSAKFNSTGAPTGLIGIACRVADDKQQTATANTSVMIVAPYLPAAPRTQALCSISFARNKKRPARVDNEAKACLDEIALELQKQPDAKVFIVGSATAKEKAVKQKSARKKAHGKIKIVDLAALRAVNAKNYLVTEKGIDAARVSAAIDNKDGQQAANYLVPPAATFTADVKGTSLVNESTVKPQLRKPLKPAHKLRTKHTQQAETTHTHKPRAKRTDLHAPKRKGHIR